MKSISIEFDQINKEEILNDPEILRPILYALDVYGKFEGLEIDDAIEEIVDLVSYRSNSGNLVVNIYSRNLIKWFRFAWRLAQQGTTTRLDSSKKRFVTSRA